MVQLARNEFGLQRLPIDSDEIFGWFRPFGEFHIADWCAIFQTTQLELVLDKRKVNNRYMVRETDAKTSASRFSSVSLSALAEKNPDLRENPGVFGQSEHGQYGYWAVIFTLLTNISGR